MGPMSHDSASAIRSFWKLRQPLSGLSHLCAGVLSTLGAVFLMQLAAHRGVWHVTAFAIFGFSMAALYFSSTLYHLLPLSSSGIQKLRRLDHAMIFVFIAGSYTPFCLLPFRNSWGLYFLVGIWGLACLGIIFKLIWFESSRWMRVGIYQAMGWVSVFILPQLVKTYSSQGLFWLFAGVACYGVGSIVYALKKPDPFPKFLGFHEIWHFFVIAGSACHFWVMKQELLFLN